MKIDKLDLLFASQGQLKVWDQNPDDKRYYVVFSVIVLSKKAGTAADGSQSAHFGETFTLSDWTEFKARPLFVMIYS